MRPTLKDAEVIFVDGTGKFVPGVISESFTQGAARIALGDKGENGSVQASYSNTGKKNTFHYKDEAEAVKKAIGDRKNADQSAAQRNPSAPASTAAAGATK